MAKRNTNINDHDFHIAELVLALLDEGEGYQETWKVSDERIIRHGLSFKVNGQCMRGEVHVVVNQETWLSNIAFYPTGGIAEVIKNVPFYRMIQTINNKVEMTDKSYTERVIAAQRPLLPALQECMEYAIDYVDGQDLDDEDSYFVWQHIVEILIVERNLTNRIAEYEESREHVSVFDSTWFLSWYIFKRLIKDVYYYTNYETV